MIAVKRAGFRTQTNKTPAAIRVGSSNKNACGQGGGVQTKKGTRREIYSSKLPLTYVYNGLDQTPVYVVEYVALHVGQARCHNTEWTPIHMAKLHIQLHGLALRILTSIIDGMYSGKPRNNMSLVQQQSEIRFRYKYLLQNPFERIRKPVQDQSQRRAYASTTAHTSRTFIRTVIRLLLVCNKFRSVTRHRGTKV